jgi:ABC-type transport system involved in cytochrome c biogenesis permease subunit
MTSDERSREEHVPGPPQESEIVAPPRISRPRAMIRVVAVLVLAGVLVGGLWAWLAPGVQAVVALTKSGDRVHGYIGEDSDHLFLAATLMVGFLTILALGAATAVWKWREHRGPEMVGALSVGLLLAAGAATGVGAGLAGLRYDTLDVAGAPVTPEHRVHYHRISRGHRRAGVRDRRAVDEPRRSRRLAACPGVRVRLGAYWSSADSGRRPTGRPVSTFALITPRRSIPR